MPGTEPPSRYDPETVRAKYLSERDRRLVANRAEIRDLEGDAHFAGYRADPFTPYIEREPLTDDAEVVVVGGGIAGILAGFRLREAGLERIRIVDQAGGIGGTWYWNRYPGVMCDVESYIYMPMLEELDYVPSQRYALGGEILGHLQAVADRYDLADDALFHTGVRRAEWRDDTDRWLVTTDRGDQLTCQYYVLAVGILNLLKLPAVPGMEEFAGRSFHSARWDYGYTGGGPGEPLTDLADKRVAIIGNGASGIQVVPPLAEAAEHVYLFQRTPSAIGERGNRPTDPGFAATLQPGWQKERMDNFQGIIMGRKYDVDLVDDAWTHDYAANRNVPGRGEMTTEEYMRAAEEVDYRIMEAHRSRVDEFVSDPVKAEIVKPYYRYLCKRPCFHDEYLPALNHENLTVVDCPGGVERVTERGPVVDGQEYAVDCIVYATGFEAEVTPIFRRAGHEIVGRGGITLAEKWEDGGASLFGMMSHRFPNMFIMPAPGQQAVVTVNYTQLAVLGAEFVGRTVGQLRQKGVEAFDVSAEAEEAWVQKIVDGFVDASSLLSACTPSRINNEGHPEEMNPRNGNYGPGLGNWFRYREMLEEWLEAGNLEGLDLEVGPTAS